MKKNETVVLEELFSRINECVAWHTDMMTGEHKDNLHKNLKEMVGATEYTGDSAYLEYDGHYRSIAMALQDFVVTLFTIGMLASNGSKDVQKRWVLKVWYVVGQEIWDQIYDETYKRFPQMVEYNRAAENELRQMMIRDMEEV